MVYSVTRVQKTSSRISVKPAVDVVVIDRYRQANLGKEAQLVWPGLLCRLDRTDPSWRE